MQLMDPVFLLVLNVAAAVLAVFLVVRSTWRRVGLSLIGLTAGAGIGALVFWWVVNVQDTFGVDLSFTIRLWFIAGCAGVGLAIMNLFASPWWRKVIAVLSVPVLLAAPAAGINADFGAYHTLDQVFGDQQVTQLSAITTGEHGEVVAGVPNYATDWQPPFNMPLHGEVGEVAIPATKSGFPARPARVYLPPAALTEHPPVLPVLFIMSGQPGSPGENFDMGGLDKVLDDYAVAHRGLAPIGIAVDQLGDPNQNPLCIDSKAFGNVQTYLTQDVPTWVRQTFRVSSDPVLWAVQGFSQGATCATQFVTGFPDLFGSGIAAGTQLGPQLHDDADTIAQGFGGDVAAFTAAQPLTIMQAHGTYSNSMMLFGVGNTDDRYRGYALQLIDAAKAVGIQTQLFGADTGHDWYAARDIFRQGLDVLGARMGLR